MQTDGASRPLLKAEVELRALSDKAKQCSEAQGLLMGQLEKTGDTSLFGFDDNHNLHNHACVCMYVCVYICP